MQVSEREVGSAAVLEARGALTGEESSALADRVASALRANLGRVVVDAEGVPYADSQGLEVLLRCAELSEAIGRSLLLSGVGPTLREALRITGLDERFDLFESADDAVRSLAA